MMQIESIPGNNFCLIPILSGIVDNNIPMERKTLESFWILCSTHGAKHLWNGGLHKCKRARHNRTGIVWYWSSFRDM